MKKIALIFGMIIVLMALVTPRVQGTDEDIGPKFQLPVDNSVIVTTDCQAEVFICQYAISVELRDHGDMYKELRAESSGLGAKSPSTIVPFTNGDLTFNASDMRDHYGTRLYNMNSKVPVHRIMSSSNGGIGY